MSAAPDRTIEEEVLERRRRDLIDGAGYTVELLESRVETLRRIADAHGDSPQGVIACGFLAVVDAIHLAMQTEEFGIREELTKTRHDLKTAMTVPVTLIQTVERLAQRLEEAENGRSGGSEHRPNRRRGTTGSAGAKT